MPEKQYTAEEALELIMRKVRARDEVLAAQIQAAIDTGKDISEIEPLLDQRKKALIYRKTVPFTHQEALLIALDVLQAHFIEVPLFVESSAINFTMAGVEQTPKRTDRPGFEKPRLNSSKEREKISIGQVDEEKALEIELQTETQIKKSGPETKSLKKIDNVQIEERQGQLNALRSLVNFQLE